MLHSYIQTEVERELARLDIQAAVSTFNRFTFAVTQIKFQGDRTITKSYHSKLLVNRLHTYLPCSQQELINRLRSIEF
jgi:hypothetical protein